MKFNGKPRGNLIKKVMQLRISIAFYTINCLQLFGRNRAVVASTHIIKLVFRHHALALLCVSVCAFFILSYPSAPICNLVQLLLYRIPIYSLTLNCWRVAFLPLLRLLAMVVAVMMVCALRARIGCVCYQCYEYKIGAVECIQVEVQKKYAVCAKNNNPAKRVESVRKKKEQQRVVIVKPLEWGKNAYIKIVQCTTEITHIRIVATECGI